ncbi:CoA pyrophosphatase [Aquabacterium sp.]|uniref:CoA pyrophosphatase n=1 Tax=Aquabacterium sp. TaxID=1872578 RepID=UPI0035AD7952
MAVTFDPLQTELLGLDEHLPAVPPEVLTTPALRARFQSPPAWQPEMTVERWFQHDHPRQASVLVPLVMRERPTVLLTQRTDHLKSHAGQISFPGGRREPSDPTAESTALREAQEEVGLSPERVELLGQMPTYTTGTGFIVTPVVGLLQPATSAAPLSGLKGDPGEVAEIFEVPLDFLMNPAHHQRRAWSLPGGGPLEFWAMPWQAEGRSQPYFIWGATAAMLRNLYRFLAA